MTTLAERISEAGIVVSDWSSHGFHADEDGWEHQRYTFVLGYADDESDPPRILETPFRTGTGWERVPEVSDILESMLSDASTVENARSFEEWAADLGYDSDSRKAEKMYRTCVEQTDRLRDFLGDRYEAFLWETDPS